MSEELKDKADAFCGSRGIVRPNDWMVALMAEFASQVCEQREKEHDDYEKAWAVELNDVIKRAEAADLALREVGQQIEFDRTEVAKWAKAIKDAVKNRDWLIEGRGNFEWNDDNWHKEFSYAAQEILAAVEPLSKIAANWKNCPTKPEEIAAARIDLRAALQAKEQELGQICEAHNYGVNILTELAAAKLEAAQARQQAIADCAEIANRWGKETWGKMARESAFRVRDMILKSLTPSPALTKEK